MIPGPTGVPLVAIRHAPTVWNAERRLQGRTDVPLSPEGEATARAWKLDPAWQDYRVIASPLARAQTTARLLFPGRAIAIDARLIEMSFGDWEGKSLAELRGKAGSDAESRERMGLDFQAPGGESPRQVQARIAPLLAEIIAPTIIVTHKAVLRALLSLATGWEMLGKPPVKLQPSTAHVFSVHEGGALAIDRMNVSLVTGDDVGPHPGPLPVGERESGGASPVPRMKPPQRTVASDRMLTVLIHVQHLLGIGHLQRAVAIAIALRDAGARVVLASGGTPVPLVEGRAASRGVEIARLPEARSADMHFSKIIDATGQPIDDAWKAGRRDMLLRVLAETAPDAIVTEMYPFGRRPFRFELTPLLEAARAMPKRPVIASSVRDVLIRNDKPGRAEEIAATVRQFYDLVLVHGDARLVPFEASFPAAGSIADRIRYTGYVTEAKPSIPNNDRSAGEILVSAGGGAVGLPLLRAAIAARRHARERNRPWRIITGTNLPEADFADLIQAARGDHGVILERFRGDFPALLARCRVSVSQGGYNTVLETLASRTPAVIVPFAEGHESEQTDRARLLADKGLIRFLPQGGLTPERLAAEIDRAAEMTPPAIAIDLGGAARSAALILEAIRNR
jgi:predicted glycosyltransferase/broad specificity phosphatase PhoE